MSDAGILCTNSSQSRRMMYLLGKGSPDTKSSGFGKEKLWAGIKRIFIRKSTLIYYSLSNKIIDQICEELMKPNLLSGNEALIIIKHGTIKSADRRNHNRKENHHYAKKEDYGFLGHTIDRH